MGHRGLVQAMETAPSRDPNEIREHALEVLREAVGATFALHYTFAEVDGALYYTRARTSGDSARLESRAGRPRYRTPMDPRAPEPRERVRFLPLLARWPSRQAYRASAVYRELHRDLCVSDELRLLVYRGDRFVAWFGAFLRDERGERVFSRRTVQRAQRLVAPATALLQTADQLEADPSGLEDAFVLADPTGRVRSCSASAERWLSGPRRDDLARLVRATDRGAGEPIVVDGVAARPTRLDGEGRVEYLLTLTPARPVRLRPDAALTRAQRRVAEYAAEGATTEEIARSLGRSPHTVQSHLKEVYLRLGVASRAELARALGDGR